MRAAPGARDKSGAKSVCAYGRESRSSGTRALRAGWGSVRENAPLQNRLGERGEARRSRIEFRGDYGAADRDVAKPKRSKIHRSELGVVVADNLFTDLRRSDGQRFAALVSRLPILLLGSLMTGAMLMH